MFALDVQPAVDRRRFEFDRCEERVELGVALVLGRHLRIVADPQSLGRFDDRGRAGEGWGGDK